MSPQTTSRFVSLMVKHGASANLCYTFHTPHAAFPAHITDSKPLFSFVFMVEACLKSCRKAGFESGGKQKLQFVAAYNWTTNHYFKKKKKKVDVM